MKLFRLFLISTFALGWASTVSNAASKISLYRTDGVVKDLAVVDVLAENSNAPTAISREKVKEGEISFDDNKYLSPFDTHSTQNIIDLSTKASQDQEVFLLKLSDRDILGYSEAARAAYIEEVGVDPEDLQILNYAKSTTNDAQRAWITWRKQKMNSFAKALFASYKKLHPKSKIYILGNVDYYSEGNFNDLRSGQDWLTWAQSGDVDGVLLEGRWLSRYGDLAKLVQYSKDWDILMKPAKHPVLLIPVSHGAKWTSESNFARDWRLLKARIPKLVQVGLFVDDKDAELQSASFIAGKQIPTPAQPVAIGQLMPEFQLPTEAGLLYSPQDWVNKSSVLALVLSSGNIEKAMLDVMEKTAKDLADKGTTLMIISPTRLEQAVTFPVLLDKGGEVVDPAVKEPMLLQVDKNGWVRDWRAVTTFQALQEAIAGSTSNPIVSEGQLAPDFSLPDMDGQERRLSSLRGKKNLVLTFFPKCFTGLCKNHLVSMNDRLDQFTARDTEVWAVSVDASDVQKDFSKMWEFKFPLIPDMGRNLSLLFGAATNTTQLSDRMTVIIDKAGVIRWIDKNVVVAKHGADVLAKMDSLGIAPK